MRSALDEMNRTNIGHDFSPRIDRCMKFIFELFGLLVEVSHGSRGSCVRVVVSVPQVRSAVPC